jgi:GT2 family glycosyltransferase
MVSVIIPVYNSERFLSGALVSILSQSLECIQIVLVNDGSTDNTLSIMKEFAARDNRIQILSRPNTGIVGALNDGIELCKGEFIARMDSDDWAHPERLLRQHSFLSTHSDVVACGTAAWIIDPRGRIVGLHRPPTWHEQIEEMLLKGNGGAFLHPSLMIRAEALKATGGYKPEFDLAEDLDLYFRLLQQGRLANLPEPLLHYRQHLSSTNFSKRAAQRKLIQHILNRERSAREMPGFDIRDVRGPADLSRAELHQKWAFGAFDCGRRKTAIFHAAACVLRAPHDFRMWKALKYVVFARSRPLQDR